MVVKKSAPKGVHSSGEPNKVLEQVTRKAVNADDPYKNPEFNGIVIYSSYLTERAFKAKYDKDFVEFVLKESNARSDKKRIIIESIVYIDQISGLLPRPDPSQESEFYKYLKGLTPKDNQEGFDFIAKKSKDMSGKNVRYLEMIKRYPRAYAIVMSEDQKTSDLGIGKQVKVKFPYDYDVYAGAITLIGGDE